MNSGSASRTQSHLSDGVCGPVAPQASPAEYLGGCDGVICFGGLDWWYHNRGHYDLQMMRELSKTVPVLYVNSLGMRTPRLNEGAMFFRRVIRKLRSFARGFRPVRKNFSVLSLVTLPFLRSSKLSRVLSARKVVSSARRMGIKNPLIWVNCPPAAELLEFIPHGRLIYQRTDRFEAFPDINSEEIRTYDQILKRGDITLYCSTSFYEEEKENCRRAVFVDHGVDYDYFSGAEAHDEPEDVRAIPRPRVGFIGGLDPHTFDPELFVTVAGKLPDYSFILVGNCTLPPGWCELPNVHLLGQRPYDSVAYYMASCDVLIMPWLQNEWIRACNPIKLKEYLAVGRPVVTSPFDEIARYRDRVSIATSADEFVEAIREAASNRPEAEELRKTVQDETWENKSELVVRALKALEA